MMEETRKETKSTLNEMIKAEKEKRLLGAWTRVYFVTEDDLDDIKYFELGAVFTSQMLGIMTVSQSLHRSTKREKNE